MIMTICISLVSGICLGQKKNEIIPTKYVSKVLLSGKNDYTYYALSENTATEYKVKGPGILTLNFRVRIEGEQFKSQPFVIQYNRSGTNRFSIEVPELLSGNLKFKSTNLDGTPSHLHKVVIVVPPGTYSYKFYKQKTEQKSHMRAFYEAHPQPEWSDLKPTKLLVKKDVRFIKTGTVRSYYALDKNSEFNFTIKDTTRLRVIIRPEFSYKMLEETIVKISLQNVTTGDTKIYKVNSEKSDDVEFVSDKKATPGVSSTFYIDIDKPKNLSENYSLSIKGGTSAAVIRISTDNNLLK